MEKVKEIGQGLLGFIVLVGIGWLIFGGSDDDRNSEPVRTTAAVETTQPKSSAPKILEQNIQLAVDTVKEYEGVVDAAVNQEEFDLQLTIVVRHTFDEQQAREIGDIFLRQVATNSGHENAMGKDIGPTRFAYTVGVYRKDQTQVALGAKAPASRNIRW